MNENKMSEVATCCAIGCMHQEDNENCCFYEFPKCRELRTKWVLGMQRCFTKKNGQPDRSRLFFPSKKDKLCSCHFSAAVIKQEDKDSDVIVPDLFSFPPESDEVQCSKFKLLLPNDSDDNLEELGQDGDAAHVFENNEEHSLNSNLSVKEMSSICSALGCSHSETDGQCDLMTFPKVIEWRRRWVYAMERCLVTSQGIPDYNALWEPEYYHKLCDCHFSFPIDSTSNREEDRHIVPDVFDFSSNNKYSVTKTPSKVRLKIKCENEYTFRQEYINRLLQSADITEYQLGKVTKSLNSSINQGSKSLTSMLKKGSNGSTFLWRKWSVCIAIGCNHKLNDRTFSFLSIPKDPEWREKWMIALKRCYIDEEGKPDHHRLFEPTENHKLCTCHFSGHFNTRTRKQGYNHIIPDILTFPPESELEEERDIWGKHRLIVTDEMRQKLGDDYPEDKMDENATISTPDNSFAGVEHAERYDSCTPVETGADYAQLYGLLTAQQLSEPKMTDENMPGCLVPMKKLLFLKEHTSTNNTLQIEKDLCEKQYINHCSAINCDHRVSQKNCSFISFPKDPEWRLKWTRAMRRCYVDEDGNIDLKRLWVPREYHRLCTCHFSVPINTKTRKIGYNHILPDRFTFHKENINSVQNHQSNSAINMAARLISPRVIQSESGVSEAQVHVIQPEHSEDGNMIHPVSLVQVIQPVGTLSDVSWTEASAVIPSGNIKVEKDLMMEDDLNSSDLRIENSYSLGPKNSRYTQSNIKQYPTIKSQLQPSKKAEKNTSTPKKSATADINYSSICSVPNCTHRKGENFCSFVSFPKGKNLIEKWVRNIGRYTVNSDGQKVLWEPDDKHKICVCHFSKPINVRSRAPEVKLIVPDIKDTSSFIPVPTSKEVAGNNKIIALKRVPAKDITIEYIRSWGPKEIDMFFAKNNLRKIGSRSELIRIAFTYVQQKRNHYTINEQDEKPDYAPPLKKLKMGSEYSDHSKEAFYPMSNNQQDDLIASVVKNVMQNSASNSPSPASPNREFNHAAILSNSLHNTSSSLVEPVGFMALTDSDLPNEHSHRAISSKPISDYSATAGLSLLKSVLTQSDRKILTDNDSQENIISMTVESESYISGSDILDNENEEDGKEVEDGNDSYVWDDTEQVFVCKECGDTFKKKKQVQKHIATDCV